MSSECRMLSPRPDGSFWVCSLAKRHKGAHSWADKPSEVWYGHKRITIDTMEAVTLALKAAEHIAECKDHPAHLTDAEAKARRALAALYG